MTMPRNRLLAAATTCAVLGLGALGAAPASAATCSNPNSPEYPNGYYTKLVVTNISCSGGKDVMHAHRKCRVRNGGIKGRCARFSGWRCTETRRSSSTEFSARVTCKKGSRKVVYYYSQDT